MRSSDEVRFVIDIEVHDAERFREVVQECVEVSRAEPGTLLYEWYLDDAGTRARLYEAYESLDAVQADAAGRVFSELAGPLLETCTFVHMDAFGDVGELVGLVPWPTTVWTRPFASLGG